MAKQILEDVHTFEGGMNLDDDITQLKPNQYRYARNMTLSSIANSSQSILSTMPGHKILASIADIKTIICTYNFTLDVPLNTGTYYNNAEILKCLNFLLIVYVGSATSSSEYNSVHTIIVALDDKLNIKLVSNNPIYAHLWRYANRTLGWDVNSDLSVTFSKTKLYVADGINQIRSFDLMKLEDYYKGGYKQDQLSSGISAEALFEPTYYEIKKDINGGFRVGCYQYLYQYFRKGGSSSPISLCSETIGLFGGDHEYNYNFTRNETSEPLTMFSQDSGTSENGTVNYRIGLEIPKSSIYNTDEDYISIWRVYYKDESSVAEISLCASQNIAVTNDKVLIDTKSAAKDIYAANKTINVYNYIDYGDATIVVDFSVTPEPSSDKINTFTIKASQINIKNDRMYAGNISYDGTGDPEGDSENLFTLSWGEKELSNIDSPVDYAPVRVDSVTYGWPANIASRTDYSGSSHAKAYPNIWESNWMIASGEKNDKYNTIPRRCEGLSESMVWEWKDSGNKMFSSYYVKGTFVNPRTNIANAYYQTGEKYLFGLIFITKDGNQTSVKCLTYVTLKESNYNYLFLWRNKMRGVYPVLKLSTKDEKKSILSTFAEIGVVGVKLVRAKRKSINRSHVWTFLGSHAFRHWFPESNYNINCDYRTEHVYTHWQWTWIWDYVPPPIPVFDLSYKIRMSLNHGNRIGLGTMAASLWSDVLYPPACPDGIRLENEKTNVVCLYCQDISHFIYRGLKYNRVDFDPFSYSIRMKEVVGVCGANLNRNDMGSHCLLGTNGFKHIWSGRAEGETHYDPESIYPFVSYCSKANMGHPNRGSFGNLYIHRVGLTVFDAVHEQSLKSSAGSNIWDTFTSSSSAEHISGDITYCHCSVHDLTASSERLFTLSGDNKKMITGSELGISLYATYPYQCTIYGGNGTIYYDGSNSPVGETPYTLFGNACGGAGRQDTWNGNGYRRDFWAAHSGPAGKKMHVYKSTTTDNAGRKTNDINWTGFQYDTSGGPVNYCGFAAPFVSFVPKSNISLFWSVLSTGWQVQYNPPDVSYPPSGGTNSTIGYRSGVEGRFSDSYLYSNKKNIGDRSCNFGRASIVRITKAAISNSAKDQFISCGNSIHISSISSGVNNIALIARFGDTYYGTNAPMTSTAIPSSATNDGWGGIRYTVFPSEHQYNPYNIRTPSIIPFIPKPTDPSNTVQAWWARQWEPTTSWASDTSSTYSCALTAAYQYYGERYYATFTESSIENFTNITKDIYVRKAASYPNRVYVSTPVPGGLSDNLLQFTENDYIDLNPNFGKITKLIQNKDLLFFFQSLGYGVISAFDRSLTKDNSGSNLSLGLGAALGGFNYISQMYGAGDGRLVKVLNDDLAFVDTSLKKLYIFSNGSSVDLLSTCNCKNFTIDYTIASFGGDRDFIWMRNSNGDVLSYNNILKVAESYVSVGIDSGANHWESFNFGILGGKMVYWLFNGSKHLIYLPNSLPQDECSWIHRNSNNSPQLYVTTIGDSSINKCFISSSIVCWQVNNQLDYLNVDNIPKSIQYKTSDRNTDFTYFFLKYDGKLEYNETDIGTVVPTNTPSTYPGEIEARNIFYQDKIYYKRTGNIYSWNIPSVTDRYYANTPNMVKIAPFNQIRTGMILWSMLSWDKSSNNYIKSIQSIKVTYTPIN